MKRTSDTTRAKQLGEDGRRYLLFPVESPTPWCFACGRTKFERPIAWYAPWQMQIAHLAAGGSKMKRHLDRRAVILLCPWCHLLHTTHGTSTRTVMGILCPELANEHVLFLKRLRDPEFWDPEWIAARWTGVLPDPVQPAEWFTNQYVSRHGQPK